MRRFRSRRDERENGIEGKRGEQEGGRREKKMKKKTVKRRKLKRGV